MARLGQLILDDDLILKGVQTDEDGCEYVDFEGLAATEHPDLQMDITVQDGVDWDYFKDHGVFNWEHSNAPLDMVGFPLEIRRNAVFKGEKGTYVKGRLLLKQARAREIYTTMKAIKAGATNRRMGLSIQGKALVRDPLDRRRILKSMISKISFTMNPMNSVTYVDLCKGLEGETGIGREAWRELVELSLGEILLDKVDLFADTLFDKALTSP